MALTNTTKWNTASNNQTKELDLLEATHIESARIRFRDRDTRTYEQNEKVINRAESGGDFDYLSYQSFPSVPSGYEFYQHIAKTTITSEESGDWELELTLPNESYDWKYGSGISGEFEKTSNQNMVGESVAHGWQHDNDWEGQGVVITEGVRGTRTKNPTVTINQEVISYNGILLDEEISDWYDITALTANQINELLFEIDNNGKVDYQIEYTYQPKLSAPARISPENNDMQTDKNMIFELELTENEDNDSNLYHAKVVISRNSDMSNIELEFESINNQDNWKLYENEEWVSFPSEGVAPGSIVRLTTDKLDYGIYYWQATSNDNYDYGYTSTTWKYRILIATDSLYLLDIEGKSYNAYQLSVIEASNGEIGGIDFALNNQDGSTFETVKTGDTVLLAVNDNLGNTEEFRSKIRNRQPSGSELQISAITGDGILADRRVKQDYTSQDIGISVKDIIDNYCSPLTSNNVDVETNIIAPIKSTDKTPLSILEELRRKYGLHYYVDKDWDMHFYLSNAIENGALTVRRGD